MFFTYDHSDLGELEVMVTDYDKHDDTITAFMVCDENGDEVDYTSFKWQLDKMAREIRDDRQAQDDWEDRKYA